MNKKIITGVILLVLIIGAFFGAKVVMQNNINEDAIKFKKEYESLNNTARESDDADYNNVTVSEDNPIKYLTVKEAIEILKSDKAILYFGAGWCP